MKPDLKREIGLRLKAARKQADLTQEALAEKAQRTVETVSKIERGVAFPSMETLEALGRALQRPLRDFFPEGRDQRRSTRRLALELRAYDVISRLSDAELEIAVDQMSALTSYGGRISRSRR
jgi:transcriptional regulator with XRE-family HTH domain